MGASVSAFRESRSKCRIYSCPTRARGYGVLLCSRIERERLEQKFKAEVARVKEREEARAATCASAVEPGPARTCPAACLLSLAGAAASSTVERARGQGRPRGGPGLSRRNVNAGGLGRQSGYQRLAVLLSTSQRFLCLEPARSGRQF